MDSILPFDLTKGQPIPAMRVDDHQVIATMSVGQLLSLVPDPRLTENAKVVHDDPLMADYASIRREVQRMVQGRKAKNALEFSKYLVEGVDGRRPWMVPAVTLYHPGQLEVVPLGNGMFVLVLPYGHFLVAIDGETQRLAWQLAAKEAPEILGTMVKVIVYHGVSLQDARQGFYDLNTREVKPNAAVAIAMDRMDVATHLTRKVMVESDVLGNGSRVNVQRRQLRRTDEELFTISALRSGVVTTIMGSPGLQIGSRPVPALADDVDIDQLESAVVDVWTGILELLEDELQPDRRPFSIVSAPAVIAAIGVVAHHAMPKPPRKDSVAGWSVEEVIEHLDGVNWDRAFVADDASVGSVWDGIAGKFTPSGRFAVGGPKEVGYAVAQALENEGSREGRLIRTTA
jgi:DGQHR domain-containing protein